MENPNNNGNGTVEQVNQQAGAQEAQPQQTPQTQAAPQQVPQQVEKKGIGGWLKEHWKGATAAAAALTAAAGSTWYAWKRGKAAGIMQATPPQQQEDYSLNPNE